MTVTAHNATQEVPCPKCGGRTWDNRLTKKSSKAPDYKCRDRACDGVIWPPKRALTTAPTGAPASAGIVAPSAPKKSISQTYIETTDFVLATIVPKYEAKEIGPTPEAIAAMVHTLFIARRKEE